MQSVLSADARWNCLYSLPVSLDLAAVCHHTYSVRGKAAHLLQGKAVYGNPISCFAWSQQGMNHQLKLVADNKLTLVALMHDTSVVRECDKQR